MTRLVTLLLLLTVIPPACVAYLELNVGSYLLLTSSNLPAPPYTIMLKINLQGYDNGTSAGNAPRLWDSGPYASSPTTFPYGGVGYSCSNNDGLTWYLTSAGTGVAPIPGFTLQSSVISPCPVSQTQAADWVPLSQDASVWIAVGSGGTAVSAHTNAPTHAQLFATSNSVNYGNSYTGGQSVVILYGWHVRVYEIAIWAANYGSNGNLAMFTPTTAVPSNSSGIRARYDFTAQDTGTTVTNSAETGNTDNITVVGAGTSLPDLAFDTHSLPVVAFMWVPAPAPWDPTPAPTPTPTNGITPTPTLTSTITSAPAPSATLISVCTGAPPAAGAVCQNGVWIINGDVTVVDVNIGGSPLAVNGSITIGGTTTIVIDPTNSAAPIQASGAATVDGTLVLVINQNPDAPIQIAVVNAGSGVTGSFSSGVVRLSGGVCAKASYTTVKGDSSTLIALISPDRSRCASKRRLPAGAIAGIVVGAVILLAVAVSLTLWQLRKRGRNFLFQAADKEGAAGAWR